MATSGTSLAPTGSPGVVSLTILQQGDIPLGHIWGGGNYSFAFLQNNVLGTLNTIRYAEFTVPAWAQPGQKLPVVLCFHGGSGWACLMRHKTGFDALGTEKGFIPVYCMGTGSQQLIKFDCYWNAEVYTYLQAFEEYDDIFYVNAVLDRLAIHFNIDLERIYACGFSNGGAMANCVAARMSDRVAATAAVAGHHTPTALGALGPANVLQVSGTVDPVAPYEGGAAGAVGTFFAPFNYPTVGACFHGWKDLLPGAARLRTHHDVHVDHEDPAAQFHSYTLGNREVKLICGDWTHTWPGGASILDEPGVGGATTKNLDTSREIWNFLEGKRLSAV